MAKLAGKKTVTFGKIKRDPKTDYAENEKLDYAAKTAFVEFRESQYAGAAQRDVRREATLVGGYAVAAVGAVIAGMLIFGDALASPASLAASSAQAAVSQCFRDPYSVVFSGVTISPSYSDGDYRVNGYANAKNGFGAYVGPRAFIAYARADGSVNVLRGCL